MIDVMQIADHADMIINGYAFTREDENIKVLGAIKGMDLFRGLLLQFIGKVRCCR